MQRFLATTAEARLERLLRLYRAAPHALWRHDVDLSLGAAASMARFANLVGVRATFAIMARGEFYNPFSYEARRTLYGIAEAGHRLVPHVHYRETENIYEVVEEDQWFWANAYPELFDVTFVVFHMPPRVVLWNDYNGNVAHKAFEHAHGSKWNGKYLSDSRGEWDAGKEALVANDMQIALHPEHWFV